MCSEFSRFPGSPAWTRTTLNLPCWAQCLLKDKEREWGGFPGEGFKSLGLRVSLFSASLVRQGGPCLGPKLVVGGHCPCPATGKPIHLVMEFRQTRSKRTWLYPLLVVWVWACASVSSSLTVSSGDRSEHHRVNMNTFRIALEPWGVCIRLSGSRWMDRHTKVSHHLLISKACGGAGHWKESACPRLVQSVSAARLA